MRADEAVKKQLGLRLKRLRRRVAELSAEINMVEQLIADVENRSVNPSRKLRRNGVAKLTMQSSIKKILKDGSGSVRAQDILYNLRQSDPSLKASTFRSHLRRMAEAQIIIRSDTRGCYELPLSEGEEKELVFRRQPSYRTSFSFE